MKQLKGFTLIELLVVIAIIAVLAAILFPVFTSAKAKAHQTSCSNNLKQITMAMLQYSDDWNGVLPSLNCYMMYPSDRVGANGDPTSAERRSRHEAGDDPVPGPLMKYIRNWSILCCPADQYHKKKAHSQDTREGTGLGLQWNYTMNGSVTRIVDTDERSDGDKCGLNVGAIRQPSKTVFMVDEHSDIRQDTTIVNDALFIWLDRVGNRHPGKRHNYVKGTIEKASTGLGTVSYLDGHTGTLPGLMMWGIADTSNKHKIPREEFARH